MNQLTIRTSPRIFQIAIGGGILCSVIGMSLRTVSSTVGTIGILAGLGTAVYAIYKLNNRATLYSLTPRGIDYGRLKIKRLPWDEISDIRKIIFDGGIYIVLKVDRMSRFDAQLTRNDRILPAGAASVGINSLSIRLDGTDIDPDVVVKFIKDRIN